MRSATVALLVLLLAPGASAAIIFTEFHANPVADESLNEWIELYNNGPEDINVSGWAIGDGTDNDSLEGGRFFGDGSIIPATGYGIVTDDTTRVYENFNISPDAVHLYIDDAALGNGLANDGETFFLYSGTALMDTASFPSSDEGLSLSLVNGIWQEAIPTPGAANNGSEESQCDYEAELILNGSTFSDPGDFWWKMVARNIRGQSTNITARADISDLFGDIVQEYSPFTNQSVSTQRTSSTFTPNLDRGKSYILAANLTTACADRDLSNNIDERIFTITGKLTHESSLDIISTLDLGSDHAAAFGQIIRARITAYRGDTSKESIAAWIEAKNGKRITKESRASIPEQYTNLTLTIPLQLEANCDEEFDDDDYTLVVEGLDERAEQDVEVEGITSSLCGTSPDAPQPQAASQSKLSFELVDIPKYYDAATSTATVRVHNNNEQEILAEIWSYIYRGSVPYSGDRESNRKLLTLPPRSTSDVLMENTPSIKEPGDYSIKFLFLPEGRKTPQDITQTVFVSKLEEAQSIYPIALAGSPEPLSNQQATARLISPPETVFMSSSDKAMSLAPYLFMAVLVLLAVGLAWRQ